MAQAVIDTKMLANHITIHAKIARMTQWQWRIRLGMWLMRLAAWVMWVNLEIDVEN